MLWPLSSRGEVPPKESDFDDIAGDTDPQHIPHVRQFIKMKTANWSPYMVSDPIQEIRLKFLLARRKGDSHEGGKAKSSVAAPASNVVDIMDALRKSGG